MIVLPVNVDQCFGELFQHAERDRMAIKADG